MRDLNDIVAYGYQLAAEAGAKQPSLRDAVWQLLVEAFKTLGAMPDYERRWLLAAERAHHPDVLVENADRAEWEATINALSLGEKLRVLGTPRVIPDKAAIDRMDEVIYWPSHIHTKNRRRDISVLCYCAVGVPTSVICGRFGVRHRNTMYGVRDRGLAHIALWLEPRLKYFTGQSVQMVHMVHTQTAQ